MRYCTYFCDSPHKKKDRHPRRSLLLSHCRSEHRHNRLYRYLSAFRLIHSRYVHLVGVGIIRHHCGDAPTAPVQFYSCRQRFGWLPLCRSLCAVAQLVIGTGTTAAVAVFQWLAAVGASFHNAPRQVTTKAKATAHKNVANADSTISATNGLPRLSSMCTTVL